VVPAAGYLVGRYGLYCVAGCLCRDHRPGHSVFRYAATHGRSRNRDNAHAARPMIGTATSCWHCGEPNPSVSPLHTMVGGVARPVCCAGCRAAAEWIDQLGLADYYRLRTSPAPRLIEAENYASSASVWARPELARHVVRDLDQTRREAMVLIEGLRCAACVWLIERALGTLPGIISVQVNSVAARARIVWDGSRCSLPRILEVLARSGYRPSPLDAGALDDARKRESRAALKRLLVAGFGAMQAMMYATALYVGALDDRGTSTRDLFRWLGLLVATPVVFYSARPFFLGATRSLAADRISMDVPVALAISLIYTASLVETVLGGAEVYFESVSMFVFLLLLGRYLEMRARHYTGDLSDALARRSPMIADRLRADGSVERIAAVELLPGDRVHLAEGSVVPADGVLGTLQCEVDESLLSGESAPIAKKRGDALVAGSVLTEGPAELLVESVGASTILAGIVALVTRAATDRPRLARAGERTAARFGLRVIILAGLTYGGWAYFDAQRAFAATLAVLVVSCPCAFALAIPTALTRALAVLARRGVLVVKPDAIENLTVATHVIFDKTGTLTDPHLALESVQILQGEDKERPLVMAAALARGSRHPVALAISAALCNAPRCHVDELHAVAGEGLEGRINGSRLRLGHGAFALPGASDADDLVVLADETHVIATFRVSDRLRPGARAVIDALKADGLTVEIISGDAAGKVGDIAARLGIDSWRARQRPADKLARLIELRAGGARVIVVGDGINDAPLLAGADVSVALASGAHLAQIVSDVVLVGEHLGALGEASAVARKTMAVLRQNHRWALTYNLVLVPLAAFGFVPPWLAALGMSSSSLVVVLNALRIRPPNRARSQGDPIARSWAHA
jgi:Cu2+-exporting ATPase